MSIFTDVAAALSFNFGDESKMPKSHYDHVQLKDRTKEQKEYIKYLKKKVDIKFVTMERLSNYIIKYRNEHNGEVSLKEIAAKTYADKKDLKKALKLLTKYENKKQKQQENIDYIINNPSPTFANNNESDNKGEEEMSTAEAISYGMFDWMAEDPDMIQAIQSLNDNMDMSEENGINLGQRIIMGMVRDNPELYNQFKATLLQSCSDVIQPIVTNTQQPGLNTLYTDLINNPETNAGVAQDPSTMGNIVESEDNSSDNENNTSSDDNESDTNK